MWLSSFVFAAAHHQIPINWSVACDGGWGRQADSGLVRNTRALETGDLGASGTRHDDHEWLIGRGCGSVPK